MIGILLITHGELGKSLIECAIHVLGDRPKLLDSITIENDCAHENMYKEISEKINLLDQGDGVANQFKSDIWIEKNNKKVNAKSIMGVMMLAASQDSDITITTEGSDEQDALDSIIALINDYFGEGE
jgi:phosphocarrier protein HPr